MTPPETSTPRRGLLVFIVPVVGLLSIIAVIGVVLLDVKNGSITPTPQIAQAPTIRFTDVPVISAIPPTHTPTRTPTDTSTPTPIPPTLTPTQTNTLTLSPVPPTATATRRPVTRTPTPIPQQASVSCVSVVGDSVAHGDAVFEVPGMGFFEAQLAPVSAFIEQQYRQVGNNSMHVLNRSASAVGISSSNHPSFFSTVEYAQLLRDNCAYTLIIPWINDLSSGTDPGSAAPTHVGALAGLVRGILQNNAQTHILIENYYQGAPLAFALRTFAAGDTPGAISTFNQQIAAACSGGALAFKQVRCIDSNAIFAASGQSYVIGQTSQSALTAIVVPPLTSDATSLVNAFFGTNPNGMINGDGVHLSNSGKAVLAAYVVPLMP